MRTTVGGDVIDGGFGGGHTGWMGMWIFAFLIIFFVVLIFVWSRRHHDEGGGLEKFLPLLGLLGLKRGHGDEERVDQARDTGRLAHDIACSEGRIHRDLDTQSYRVEKAVDRNLVESKNDRIRELENALAEEKTARLHEATLGAIGKSEAKTTHRFDLLEGKIMKKPEFFAYGAPQSFGFEGNPAVACAR